MRRRLLSFFFAFALVFPMFAHADVQTEMSPLPYDASPGCVPDPASFSDKGYFDESIDVSIETARRDSANFYVAYVKIKHGSQLRTALAGDPGSKKTNKITTLAKNNNAVVALNGDFYTDRDKGLTIRQGVTIRDSVNSLLDTLLIDTEGDFHIVTRDNPDMLDFYLSGGLTIQNAFSFGPALVVDGVKQPIPEKYSFAPHYLNPRAAIGQLGPLSYALVVVDGRLNDSDGCTLETLADFMESIGCQQAFNLDGGNSATLVLNGEICNEKSLKNERSVSDILYFATYVDSAVQTETPAA